MLYIAPIIAVLVIILLVMATSLTRGYKKIMKDSLKQDKIECETLCESDIMNLPKVIQRYIIHAQAIGKAKIHTISSFSIIDINLGQGKGWAKMEANEFNSFGKLLIREVLMKFKLKGLPVYGYDYYLNHHGGMKMKPLGLIPVVDAKGHQEDDSSALVMLLLNMFSVPSALIDERLTWTPLDALSVAVSLNDEGLLVKGVVRFNENDEIVSFTTDDKYYAPNGDDYQQVSWSTYFHHPQMMNGMMIPTEGDAIWHFPEGDECYGKLHLKQIEFR